MIVGKASLHLKQLDFIRRRFSVFLNNLTNLRLTNPEFDDNIIEVLNPPHCTIQNYD